MLEVVVNISEGRSDEVLRELADAAHGAVLDVHRDPDHHRSVFTLVGEDAARALAARAVELVDLRQHTGVHPRIGVVDVVPFVPLGASTMTDALAARDRFAAWISTELGVPAFLYGPERTLPELRRGVGKGLAPDRGGPAPHPTAGAVAVGARTVLVAYNLWLALPDLDVATRVAAAVRQPGVRTLGLPVGDRVQLSMNLVDPLRIGPAQVEAEVAQLLAGHGNAVAGAELVGLVPEALLRATPPEDWARLDLDPGRTIEARLAALGQAVTD